MSLSHEQRRHRRHRIAESVRDGMSISQVCQLYRVGPSTVRNALDEGGIARAPRARMLAVVRDLLDGRRREAIAARQGITASRVAEIEREAREAGLLENMDSDGEVNLKP